MKTIYVPDAATEKDLEKSIFLAGPTPRDKGVKSWRPEFIQVLKSIGFDGTVLVPEDKHGEWKHDYLDQVEWEFDHLQNADCIVFWVPRDLETLPGFTTNVEFGYWLSDDKMFYGRPFDAPKTKYLDWIYEKLTREKPCDSMHSLAERALVGLEEMYDEVR